MSRRIALALTFALIAPAAHAASEICEELWFTRNAMFDQAGFCFSSPLGRAVFDNRGCVGADVDLTTEQAALVDEVRTMERDLNCKVDTQAASLGFIDFEIRRDLDDFPMRDWSESSCIGWIGARAPMYAGAAERSRVTGWIEPGDNVLSSHTGRRDAAGRFWTYYTVYRSGSGARSTFKTAGWVAGEIYDNCQDIAG